MAVSYIEMQMFEFGLLLLAAYIGGKITQKLHIGEIVGQILGGVLAGPHSLEFLYPAYHDGTPHFPEYAGISEHSLYVVLLLLGILAFSFGNTVHRLRGRHLQRDLVVIGLIQALFTFWLLALGFWSLFGVPVLQALLIASIGVMSAPVLTSALLKRADIEKTLRDMLADILIAGEISQTVFFAIFLTVAGMLQHKPAIVTIRLIEDVGKGLFWMVLPGFCIFLLLKFSLNTRFENIMPVVNLFFFALIGSMIRVESFNRETLLYIAGFLVLRASGKMLGTWGVCRLTGRDPKMTACLPTLVLPQSGLAAAETILAASVLKDSGGMQLVNTLVPSLLIFELLSARLSEKTLRKWREWTIGEREALIVSERGEPDFSLSDLLAERIFEIAATTKDGAIAELARSCVTFGIVPRADIIRERILEREQLGSTGIGGGIALPHCRTDTGDQAQVICGLVRHPIPWGAPDLQPVELVFLITNPAQYPELHLKAIQTINLALQRTELLREYKQAFAQNNDEERADLTNPAERHHQWSSDRMTSVHT